MTFSSKVVNLYNNNRFPFIHKPISECSSIHLNITYHIPYYSAYYFSYIKIRIYYLKFIIASVILFALSIIYIAYVLLWGF